MIPIHGAGAPARKNSCFVGQRSND